jgi:hypothetical protein
MYEPTEGLDVPATTAPKGRSLAEPEKVVPAARAGFTWRKSASAARVERFLELFVPEVIDQPLIRVGSKHDGGYLIPDDLEGIGYVISPGVGPVVDFDADMAARGIDVVMLDASVKGPPIKNDRFHFKPVFLDSYVSDTTTTIDAEVAALPADVDLLLEMDIEGSEWKVIHSMSAESQRRFRIMAIEFHPITEAAHKWRLPDFESGIRKLLTTHRIVHVHLNNASSAVRLGGHRVADAIEVTFHRRDRSASHPGEQVTLPHPLDTANLPILLDHKPPRIWGGKK